MSTAEVFEMPVPRGADWQEYAACKGRTELFFAKKAERPQARDRREARARQLCTVCPVQVSCRTWAREHREYGFWAGENEEERHPARLHRVGTDRHPGASGRRQHRLTHFRIGRSFTGVASDTRHRVTPTI